MTKSELFARRLNKKILELRAENPVLLVAIDGYAASGKTTVLNHLTKLNTDILPIHLDDFLVSGLKRKKMLSKAKEVEKSTIYQLNWYEYKIIEKLLKEFKAKKAKTFKYNIFDYDKNKYIPTHFDLSKKILVIEGIFLFHPKLKISKEWDLKVFIDTDLEKSDKRLMTREKKRWGKNYVSEDHPDSFIKVFKRAYREYLKTYKPSEIADLILHR